MGNLTGGEVRPRARFHYRTRYCASGKCLLRKRSAAQRGIHGTFDPL